MKKYQRGMTFIELILVLSLIGILGFLSTGFYARFYSQSNVATVVDQVAGQLRKAQIYSMTGKKGDSWGVYNGINEIVLFKGNSYIERDTAFDEAFTVSSNVTISGFTDIIFARETGTPSAAATITITGRNSTKTLTINAQGAVNE